MGKGTGQSGSDVRALELLLSRREAEIRDLKNVVEIYENVQELSRQERIEQDQMLDAYREMEKLSRTEMVFKDITLRGISEINTEITRLPPSAIMLKKIMDSLMLIIAAERGAFFLMENGTLYPGHLRNLTQNEIYSPEFSPSFGIIRAVAEKRESVLLVLDSGNGPASGTALSVLCAPLKDKEGLMGVIYLDTSSREAPFRNMDLDTLNIYSIQSAIALENATLYHNLEENVAIRTKELSEAYKKLIKVYDGIKKDLSVAKTIQESILPKNIPPVRGFNFYVKYLPKYEVGGDIYDVAEIAEGRLRVFLADATGHGIQAALVTMTIMAEYAKLRAAIHDPAELIRQLNNQFMETYHSLTVFFTCIVLDIDLQQNMISFCSAGHPTQYLISGDAVVPLYTSGAVVGVIDNTEYRTVTRPVSRNDKIILFTDGIMEEFDDSSNEFGEDRIRDLLDKNRMLSIQEIVDRIIGEIRDFLDVSDINDDITMIGIAV